MQDTSRVNAANRLPRLGAQLSRLRAWESDFRHLAGQKSFSELNLPLSLPASEFLSRLTGEAMLPAGPRFSDSNGTEWALRTDLTVFSAQFVARHASDLQFPFRLFYSGKVFSPQGLLGAEGFRLGHASEFESLEFGAEIVGETGLNAEIELLDLVVTALRRFGYGGITVTLGDVRIVAEIENIISKKIADQRNVSRVRSHLRDALFNKDLARLGEWLRSFELDFAAFWRESEVYQSLLKVVDTLRRAYPEIVFVVDPLMMRQRKFYSGLVLDFWAKDADGYLKNVGGGGRYDTLLQHFGLEQAAVGFMLRDPHTTGTASESGRQSQAGVTIENAVAACETRRPIRIALPKGRLQKWGLQVFKDVGVCLQESPENTRKLAIKSQCGNYEFLFVKNSDVVSYVERGIAEFAIAGSDVLDETDASNVLRPVTFTFGECRLCLAGRPQDEARIFGSPRPRVATKYPHLALRLLRDLGLDPELVPLQGSVELASVISFCDAIVDLVETGSTLRENGLIVFQDLARTRVQLVTSKGAYAQFHAAIRDWLQHWTTHGHANECHFDTAVPEGFKNDSHSQDK